MPDERKLPRIPGNLTRHHPRRRSRCVNHTNFVGDALRHAVGIVRPHPIIVAAESCKAVAAVLPQPHGVQPWTHHADRPGWPRIAGAVPTGEVVGACAALTPVRRGLYIHASCSIGLACVGQCQPLPARTHWVRRSRWRDAGTTASGTALIGDGIGSDQQKAFRRAASGMTSPLGPYSVPVYGGLTMYLGNPPWHPCAVSASPAATDWREICGRRCKVGFRFLELSNFVRRGEPRQHHRLRVALRLKDVRGHLPQT